MDETYSCEGIRLGRRSISGFFERPVADPHIPTRLDLQLTEGEVGLNFLESKIECGFVVKVRAKGNFVGFLKKQTAAINALGSQRSRLFAEVKRLYMHLGCLRQSGHGS